MSQNHPNLPINKNFISVGLDTPLTEVVTKLSNSYIHNIDSQTNGKKKVVSCVLVINKKRLVGLITERDIVKLSSKLIS